MATPHEVIETILSSPTPDATLLAQYLHDTDPIVRDAAVRAIGEIGDVTAGSVLLEHVHDSDICVRSCVAEALGWLRHQPAAGPLAVVATADKSWLVRRYAAEALGYIGVDSPDVVAALLRAVQTDRPLVQAYAAASLGRLGVLEAAPVIRQRLAKERRTRIRTSMFEGLIRLGDPEAFQSLLRVAERTKNSRTLAATGNILEDLASPTNATAILEALQRRVAKDPEYEEEYHRTVERFARWGLIPPPELG